MLCSRTTHEHPPPYLLQIDLTSAHEVVDVTAASSSSPRLFRLRAPLALELHLDASGAGAFVVKVEALVPAAGWVRHALQQQQRHLAESVLRVGLHLWEPWTLHTLRTLPRAAWLGWWPAPGACLAPALRRTLPGRAAARALHAPNPSSQ